MAAPFELTGTVKVLMDTMTFPSGFSKREFVVTSEDEYPQDIKFACVKERISQLDKLQPADRVKVSFRIRGNEYQGRYFVDLQAFKVEKLDADGSAVEYDNLEPSDAVPPDTEMPF
ncbi:MAG: DUF3127 domain-containing protein [Kiritimatiellae bacterium]|nr:DUF3127 domain-containing protein [Kiritimatiellia bacterium]